MRNNVIDIIDINEVEKNISWEVVVVNEEK